MHISFQLKTSSDYEIYELEDISKSKLDDICDLRQPVVLSYHSDLLTNCSLSALHSKYGNLDLNIRDITDVDDKSEFYIPLTLNNSMQLLYGDKEQKYITERNADFVKEAGIRNFFKENNNLLKPYGTFTTVYDIISGSTNSFTPLRYEMNYRNFFYVTEGSVSIKLTPPTNSKYLQIHKDYDYLEFRSEINPWNCQKQFINDFNKVRFLDIILTPGMMLFIPAYWSYSIKFNEVATICNFKYRTLLNSVTISPHLLIHFLQKTNIKYTTTKNKKDLSTRLHETNNNTEPTDKPNTEKDNLNSFGQPKSIEEISVEHRGQTDSEISLQQTQNKSQINISNEHEQLIRPALESPQKDSTSIAELTTAI